MDKYEETFQTWNKVAKRYEDKFMDLGLYNDTYDAFCDLVPEANASILEIGCGPGNITRYVLTRRPDFSMEGIDIAPGMIELAQKNNPTATFRVMDARDLSQLNRKFDGIIAGFCLPYLSPNDGARFIRSCGEMLTDKGALYLSFVEGEPRDSGYQTASSGDRTYFYYYRLEDLIQKLEDNQFSSIQCIKKEYCKAEKEYETHTIILAKK